MKKYLSLIATAVLALALTGCATLFGDNDKTVAVNTVPQGAEVYVNNMPVGTTPTKVAVTTGSPTMVTFKKPGYQTQTAIVNNKFQPVGLWNIFFWPGFIVDAVSGDTMKIAPDSRVLDVTMTHTA